MARKRLCGDQYMSLQQMEDGTLIATMGDGVAVVPLNDNNEVIMITEPSRAYNGLRSLLLVTGEIEDNETGAESANRELQEEIGFKAGRIDSLGTVYTSIKYVESKVKIYLARDLTPASLEGDEPEGWIQIQDPIPLSEIESLIADGKLLNSETITSLFLARSFLQNETD